MLLRLLPYTSTAVANANGIRFAGYWTNKKFDQRITKLIKKKKKKIILRGP